MGSRRLQDRAAVQRTLRRVVGTLNDELEPALAAPLKVVAGDEVQGLFSRGEAVSDVVVRIADVLHPVSMVWGLGHGGLTTERAEDVSVMDGPCLHRARDAVEVAASEGRWVVVEGLPRPHGEVLTTLFGLVWALRSSWTDTQMKYIRGARHRKQTEVADRYGVTRQAVSKVLDAAGFRVVSEGEAAIRRYLGWVSRSSDDALDAPSPETD